MAKKNVGAPPSNPNENASVQFVSNRFILGAVGTTQPPAGTPWGIFLPLLPS